MSANETYFQELAAQLRKPTGEKGIEVGNMMYESNLGMIQSTANALSISKADEVLELGHGNGKHIPEILKLAESLNYTGLEIAELMKQQAEALQLPHTQFQQYDGEQIPFNAESFHKAMTVNTIYFWKNPTQLLTEVYRILKKDGLFSIGFAAKEFMEILPFTPYGFKLYTHHQFEELVSTTPFKIIALTTHQEKIPGRADEMIERNYSVATLKK